MSNRDILNQNNISSKLPVLSITAMVAIENLSEAVNRYCPSFRIDELSREELLSIFESYANSVLLYHQENYHQERGALLQRISILKRHGATKKEIESLDFI